MSQLLTAVCDLSDNVMFFSGPLFSEWYTIKENGLPFTNDIISFTEQKWHFKHITNKMNIKPTEVTTQIIAFDKVEQGS